MDESVMAFLMTHDHNTHLLCFFS